MFKKRKNLMLLFVLVLMVGLVAVGCGGGADAPAPDDNGEVDSGDAEWPSNISLGTAGTGGVYYTYGSGWGNLIDERISELSVNIEQSGGPADNMTLVHYGDNDLGMITMGIGYEGFFGIEDTNFAGQPHDNVRGLFPMYSTYSQWWAHADSGITSVFDLEGKTVGVGPTGGTPGTYHPLILQTLGIDATPSFAALGDLVESHQDGQIDANSFSSGIPTGGILQYEANVGTDNLVFFGIDGDAREQIMSEYPYWISASIPADTYDFLDSDIETIAVFNWAVANKDLPDDLVYEIVDIVMTSNDHMMGVHDASAETVPEAIDTNTFLPLHPGAYDWFVDNGYEDSIHPDAVPAERQ